MNSNFSFLTIVEPETAVICLAIAPLVHAVHLLNTVDHM